MCFFDILMGVVLIWAIYQGFKKGFLFEVAKLVGLFLGFWCAVHFSSYIKNIFIEKYNISGQLGAIISFILTFILVLVIIYFLATLLEKFMKTIKLGIINSLAGAMISILKYTMIISVFFYILRMIHVDKILFSQDIRDKSYFYKPITRLAPIIIPKIKQLNMDEELDSIEKKIKK